MGKKLCTYVCQKIDLCSKKSLHLEKLNKFVNICTKLTFLILVGAQLNIGTHPYVTSPNYPLEDYPSNVDCKLTIIVPPGNNIKISFVSFTLEYDYYCQ